MTDFKFVSIDFQKEFTSPTGMYHNNYPSVQFIKQELIPYFRKKRITLAEIVSDYRQPRPGDPRDCCKPGCSGYESEIPDDLKLKPVWIKAMNSPLWTRENIGIADRTPGLPYQDPKGFNDWLENTVGKPEEKKLIVLIGLTLDSCVLCAAQEFRWHGYDVRIIEEATDTSTAAPEDKQYLIRNPPITKWAKGISWSEVKKNL